MEVERRADHQKALRPGEPLERDAKRAADIASRAVRADQPAIAFGLALAAALDRHGDVVGRLADVTDRAREGNFEVRLAAQPVVDDPGQFGLFALQPEWM